MLDETRDGLPGACSRHVECISAPPARAAQGTASPLQAERAKANARMGQQSPAFPCRSDPKCNFPCISLKSLDIHTVKLDLSPPRLVSIPSDYQRILA